MKYYYNNAQENRWKLRGPFESTMEVVRDLHNCYKESNPTPTVDVFGLEPTILSLYNYGTLRIKDGFEQWTRPQGWFD